MAELQSQVQTKLKSIAPTEGESAGSEALSKQIEGLKKENSTLRKNFDDLRLSVQQVYEDFVAADSERTQLREQVKSLKATPSQEKLVAAAPPQSAVDPKIVNEYERQKQTIDTLQKKLASYEAIINQRPTPDQALIKLQKEFEQYKKDALAEIEKLEAALQTKEADPEKLAGTASRPHATAVPALQAPSHKDLEVQNKNLSRQLFELQEELKSVQSKDWIRLKEDLSEKTQFCETLQKDLQSLEEKYAVSQADLEARNKSVQALKQQLKELTDGPQASPSDRRVSSSDMAHSQPQYPPTQVYEAVQSVTVLPQRSVSKDRMVGSVNIVSLGPAHNHGNNSGSYPARSTSQNHPVRRESLGQQGYSNIPSQSKPTALTQPAKYQPLTSNWNPTAVNGNLQNAVPRDPATLSNNASGYSSKQNQPQANLPVPQIPSDRPLTTGQTNISPSPLAPTAQPPHIPQQTQNSESPHSGPNQDSSNDPKANPRATEDTSGSSASSHLLIRGAPVGPGGLLNFQAGGLLQHDPSKTLLDQLTQAIEQRDKHAQQLKSHEQEIERLKGECKRLETELKKLSTPVSQPQTADPLQPAAEQERLGLENKIKELEGQLSAVQKKLAESEQKKSDLELQLTKSKEPVSGEIDQLKSAVKQLEQLVAAKDSQIKSLQSPEKAAQPPTAANEHEKEISDLKSQVKQLEAQLTPKNTEPPTERQTSTPNLARSEHMSVPQPVSTPAPNHSMIQPSADQPRLDESRRGEVFSSLTQSDLAPREVENLRAAVTQYQTSLMELQTKVEHLEMEKQAAIKVHHGDSRTAIQKIATLSKAIGLMKPSAGTDQSDKVQQKLQKIAQLSTEIASVEHSVTETHLKLEAAQIEEQIQGQTLVETNRRIAELEKDLILASGDDQQRAEKERSILALKRTLDISTEKLVELSTGNKDLEEEQAKKLAELKTLMTSTQNFISEIRQQVATETSQDSQTAALQYRAAHLAQRLQDTQKLLQEEEQRIAPKTRSVQDQLITLSKHIRSLEMEQGKAGHQEIKAQTLAKRATFEAVLDQYEKELEGEAAKYQATHQDEIDMIRIKEDAMRAAMDLTSKQIEYDVAVEQIRIYEQNIQQIHTVLGFLPTEYFDQMSEGSANIQIREIDHRTVREQTEHLRKKIAALADIVTDEHRKKEDSRNDNMILEEEEENQELQDLKANNEQLRHKIERQDHDLTSKDSLIEEAKKRSELLQTHLDQLRAQLTSSNHSDEGSKQSNQLKIQDLEQKNLDLSSLLTNTQHKLKEAEAKIVVLEQDLAKSKEAAENLENLNQMYQSEVTDRIEEVKTANTSLEKAEGKIAEAQKLIDTLRKELADISKVAESSAKQATQLTTQLADKDKEAQKASSDLQASKKQVEALTAQVTVKDLEIETLNTRCKLLDSETSDRVEEVKKANGKLEEANRRNEDLEKTISNLKNDSDSVAKQNRELQETVRSLQDEVRTSKISTGGDLEAEKTKIELEWKKIHEERQTLNEEKASALKFQEDILQKNEMRLRKISDGEVDKEEKALHDKIEKLEKDLAKAKEDKSRSQKALNEVKLAKDNVDLEISELKRELKKTKDKAESTDKACAEVKKEAQKSKQQNDKLEDELFNLKLKLREAEIKSKPEPLQPSEQESINFELSATTLVNKEGPKKETQAREVAKAQPRERETFAKPEVSPPQTQEPEPAKQKKPAERKISAEANSWLGEDSEDFPAPENQQPEKLFDSMAIVESKTSKESNVRSSKQQSKASTNQQKPNFVMSEVVDIQGSNEHEKKKETQKKQDNHKKDSKSKNKRGNNRDDDQTEYFPKGSNPQHERKSVEKEDDLYKKKEVKEERKEDSEYQRKSSESKKDQSKREQKKEVTDSIEDKPRTSAGSDYYSVKQDNEIQKTATFGAQASQESPSKSTNKKKKKKGLTLVESDPYAPTPTYEEEVFISVPVELSAPKPAPVSKAPPLALVEEKKVEEESPIRDAFFRAEDFEGYNDGDILVAFDDEHEKGVVVKEIPGVAHEIDDYHQHPDNWTTSEPQRESFDPSESSNKKKKKKKKKATAASKEKEGGEALFLSVIQSKQK